MLSVVDIATRYAYPPNLTRPWVRTNFVSSIDGGAQDARGLSGGLGGPDDTKIFAVLRSLADVILVGAGTARREGYGPVKPEEIHPEVRPDAAATTPPIAVVSESLDVPDLLIAPGQILITHKASDSAIRERLAETMDVIVAGENAIDWDEALAQLSQRGLQRVLCEGGPRLQGDLIATDHVDELCLSVATVLVGGEAKRIATGPVGPARAMRLADTITGDGVLATRWIRDREA